VTSPRDAVDLLRARVEQTPAALASTAALAERFVRAHREALTRPTRWSASGVGASEGVARAALSALERVAHRGASLRPLSCWIVGEEPLDDPSTHGIILFSQGLSPNARAALRSAPRGALRVLVTAATEHPAAREAAGAGWLVCAQAPREEDGLLVRVTGPCCALVVIRALTHAIGPGEVSALDAGAPEAFRDGLAEGKRAASCVAPEALGRVRALLSAGDRDDSLSGLAWAWMEATLTAPVAAWDALGFAHGPFQALYEQEVTLVSFERDARESALFDLLASMLDPRRHTLVRVRARDEDGWGPLRRHGALWGLALALLDQHPRPLAAWPGKGLDGPLYDLQDRPK
jgi:hypothetical protein